MAGGTGQKFAGATTVVAGVASLIATLLSIVSIWLQLKNYRKPLLQRYVARILLMVPIYSISSWTSMVSIVASQFFDPIRDIYEAFTIYTFFQLLINYIGGERALIVMMHGRAPVEHLWPMNRVLPKVDISDPHTFLAVKRGILQYAWMKPLLCLATIIMKAVGVYQEGYIGLKSGYFWSGIIYNISVTVSLYSLGLFWVCMHEDLKPFRPVPKFLCVKLIIFASYWQGFFLSLLVFVGAIPDNVQGYTPDNLAVAIQDALICLEMPIFAVAHWYAFSWKDFANNDIYSARMPVGFALRDAFGIKDLIEDSKQTFRGDTYGYRFFDSGDKIMAHEDSTSRLARIRDGMRYERGGKGKYWVPKPRDVNARTPLLSNPGPSVTRTDSSSSDISSTFEEPQLNDDEERLYNSARQLEFGDWNYPVITASEPLQERLISSGYARPPAPPGQRPKPASLHVPVAAEPVVVKQKKKKRRAPGYERVVQVPANPEPQPAGEQFPTIPDAGRQSGYNPVQQVKADSEESQQWALATDAPDHPTATNYQIDEQDEFQNVWGSRDRS